jgi:formate hydrogenlyase transcriptional activator
MQARGISEAEWRFRLLRQLGAAFRSAADIAEILKVVQEGLQPFIPAEILALAVADGANLRFLAGPLAGETFPLAASALHGAGVESAASLERDLKSWPRFAEDTRLAEVGVRSCVRCPLITSGRIVGMLIFGRRTTLPFDPEEAGFLEDVCAFVAPAVSSHMAQAEIERWKDRLHTESLLLKAEIDRHSMFEEIVGSAPGIQRVLEAIERVAPTDSTVLITGETGTGKELVARAIHKHSRRSSRVLVIAHCAAIPETLVASELFGHEKGAFTGAFERHIGRFESANGGTIFLDEIGELSAETQVALLRVLQNGEFERVGGRQTIYTDVRVIAATNRDLPAAIAAGRFRSDLYYRLNVFPIQVPPLRERREDIPLLVDYFAARFAARAGKKIRGVERRTARLLASYDWPGNVRELQNVVERAVILSDDGILRIDPGALAAQAAPPRPRSSRLSLLREKEKELIEAALAQSHGRVAGPKGAAAALGIPASTLESKIRRLRIDKYRHYPRP